MRSLFIYIGYTAGVVFFLLGIAMLAGFVFPKEAPVQLKTVMGITLLLYGLYRLTTTYFKAKQNTRLSKEENETRNPTTIL